MTPIADALAQELEEVVVTAQKREQSIQEVPVSVSAFTAKNMQNMGLQTVGDTLNFVPNVARSSGPSSTSDAFFFFRGVGQVDNNVNVDPGVAVYIDDVYLGRTQGASFDLVDIQRVEILRGPQGTFFGRNTVGGAVSIHTTDPADEFGFKARVAAGERNRMDASAAWEIPVSERLGARFSLFTRNQDGWARSQYTGDTYGDVDDVGGRLKVVWDATDDVQVGLAADYTDGGGSPIPSSLLAFNPDAGSLKAGSLGPGIPPFDTPGGGPTGVPFPPDTAADLDSDPFDRDIKVSIPAGLDTDRGGVSLHLDWTPDAFTFRSITAWRMVDQTTYTDLDSGGYSIYDAVFGVDQDQFSQEFQFLGDAFDGRLHWLLGLYYFEESVQGMTDLCTGTNTAIPSGMPPPFPGFFPGPAARGDGRCLSFVSNIDLDVESYAAFGQVEYDITDKLTALVGFRYTDEEKTQAFDTYSDNTDGVVSIFPPPIAPLPGTIDYAVSPNNPFLMVPYEYNDSWDEFSPKLGLNYQATDNLMLYISWSNGFKSGGFSGRATPLKPLEAYDPETIETWEVGIKSEWLDRRLRLNAAAFYSEYDDVQLLILESGITANAQFITANGGNNEIQGVEFELFALPTPNLQFTLGAGWLDTEWAKLALGSVDKDDVLANAPEYTINASAQYTFGLGDFGKLALRADYSYTDDVSYQPENDPGEIQDGYGFVNVRASLTPNESAWSISLYGRNVTDEEYFLIMNDTRGDLGINIATPAPPAEWGLEVTLEL
ncbi:MAG: TonB-dependent receptor [Halioglobus sp.]|nr:TonB-dependent receptor [Halioglobus sp.]